jgi:hypothetical protein
MTNNETTRRTLQIAYDNRMPAEGEWCEGFAVDHCYEGSESSVVTIQRTNMRTGVRVSYTYCPRCRALAEVEALTSACEAISDAIAELPLSDDTSHRVTTLRATLSSALREAQAERETWRARGAS